MNVLKTMLTGVLAVTAVALPLQSATAWGGPWGPPGAWGGPPGAWGGPPGAWGGPGVMAPPGVAGAPGWGPDEVAERYDFNAPYGPSITDIRRYHRDMAWGRPFDDVRSPLGPSPTDIRRKERRELLRGFGAPY